MIDQPVAMSWGALFHYDFANANLLILLGCDPHLRYVPEDIRTITAFLEEGGGVVLLGSTADEPQNDLAREFGCTFGPPAHKPLQSASAPIAGEIAGGGDTLNLQETNLWRVLVVDAQGNPMLARRTVGKGTLLVGARGLAGHNPDASDNINAAWWRPLLADVASGKRVDPAKPFRGRGWGELELSESLGSITLRYSSYLKPYAKSMADIYARCRPVIEQRMGVPLSEGMASEIVLLATGGGGFSSGRTLGLAAFWGGFPDREDSMIEFITHESVHSWVLPSPNASMRFRCCSPTLRVSRPSPGPCSPSRSWKCSTTSSPVLTNWRALTASRRSKRLVIVTWPSAACRNLVSTTPPGWPAWPSR